MKLNGKTALITGGASGLGLAIAREFAVQGAKVVLADIDIHAARRAAEAISGPGPEPLAVEMNVRDAESVFSVTGHLVSELGPIDVLVTSAGIGRIAPLFELTVEDFDLVLSTNLRGTFVTIKAVAQSMKEKGGSIVTIGSASGHRGSFGRAAYGSSKAAVKLLTEVLAVELAQFGIRVNSLSPGPIETPILKQLPSSGREKWSAMIPMNRFGETHEVAKAALFLASDDSSYVTGATLNIDGGYAAGGILR